MSDMTVNKVLDQMQALRALAQGEALKPKPVDGENPFGATFKNAIEQVNQTQKGAAELAKAFELGDENVNLADVMVSLQKAKISFQALTQVRNKALAAYQEIMSMQV